MKAKTSYRRRCIELIVESKLEAKHRRVKSKLEVEELDIAVKVTSIEVVSIEVVAKVGRIRLYLEVAEMAGQAGLYVSNLLAFLEDSEVEAVAERIEVAGKLDTVIGVARKLDLENSEVLDLESEALEVR